MKGTPAIYLGQILSKEHQHHFRAYIYAADGSEKLIDSWDDFQKHMETGLWVACKDKIAQKRKGKRAGNSDGETEKQLIESKLELQSDVIKIDYVKLEKP